jgi:putative ABC transport system permease protein
MMPRVRAQASPALSAEPWQTYAQAALADAKGDKLFYYIMIGILILVSVSTIASTMSMSVLERTREIGTLRATGWERRDIVRLFLLEALMVGVLGSIAGLLLSAPVVAYLTVVGIDYSRMGETVALPIFRMICRPQWPDAVLALFVGVAATFGGGLLPARHAGRLAIVDCLKNA